MLRVVTVVQYQCFVLSYLYHIKSFFITKYRCVLLDIIGDMVYNIERSEIPNNNRIVNRRIAKIASRVFKSGAN